MDTTEFASRILDLQFISDSFQLCASNYRASHWIIRALEVSMYVSLASHGTYLGLRVQRLRN